MKLQISLELLISMVIAALLAVSFMAMASWSHSAAYTLLKGSEVVLRSMANSYQSLLSTCHGCLHWG
jgi:sensor domain CHASE-containing protein